MVRLKNISKIYKTKQNVITALDNVSFLLPETGLIAFVGKSGSGKSTLLHIIGQIENTTSGRIENEVGINDYSYIFQDFNLITDLSVIDNIKLGYGNFHIEENDDRIDEILNKLNIFEYKNKLVSKMSQGEKQRVAIARALYRNAKILLADEPTGSLDKENANNIFEILKNLSKDILVIVSSHDLKLVEKYADRVIKLQKGKIVSDETLTTNNKNQNIRTVNKSKSKRSNKLYIKLALLNTFKKHVLQNIILFFIMTSLFAMSFFILSIVTFNPQDRAIKTMYEDGKLQTLFRYFDNDGNKVFLSNKEVKNDQFLKDIQVVYPINQNMVILNIDNHSMNVDKAYIVGMEEDNLVKFKYQMHAGFFPKEIGEIAITRLQFEVMKRYGIRIDDEVIEIRDVNDILNMQLKSDNQFYFGNFTITGIIDTNFNLDYFNQLLNKGFLSQELKYILEETAHNLVYVNYEYNDFYTTVVSPFGKRENTNLINSFLISVDSNDLINEGEIILSHETAYQFKYINKSITQYYNDHLNQIIDSYAETYYPQIKETFESDVYMGKWWLAFLDFGDEIDFNDYATYIKQRVIPNATNQYDSEMDRQSLTQIATDTFVKYIPIESTDKIIFTINGIEKALEVKYFITAKYNMVHYEDLFYFDGFIESKSYDRFLILDENINNLERKLKVTNNYRIFNEYIYQANDYNLTIENYRYDYPIIFEVILGIFILLITLIGCSFIYTRLKIRRKEKGLLKTLGYSSKKIYSNFMIEPIINYLLQIFCSIFLARIILTVVNQTIQARSYLFNQMLINHFNHILLIFMIGILTGIFALMISIKVDQKKTLSSIIREF